jgi:hypothetical protein
MFGAREQMAHLTCNPVADRRGVAGSWSGAVIGVSFGTCSLAENNRGAEPMDDYQEELLELRAAEHQAPDAGDDASEM